MGAVISLVIAAMLWFGAVVMDGRGKPYLASLLGTLGLLFFLVMLGIALSWSRSVPMFVVPSATPEPLPSHGPACVDLAWLDGKWTCVPADQAG